MSSEADAAQVATWEKLRRLVRKSLSRFGVEGVSRDKDFWVDDDNFGTAQQKVYFRNLRLLEPAVIRTLQALLQKSPAWKIVVAISVPGAGDAWPDMGLNIRADEIIDDLKREYLPAEFRSIYYPGSRSPAQGE
ncbi:MAG: hypothetical protein AB7K64_06720 [Variibacter sp.]